MEEETASHRRAPGQKHMTVGRDDLLVRHMIGLPCVCRIPLCTYSVDIIDRSTKPQYALVMMLRFEVHWPHRINWAPCQHGVIGWPRWIAVSPWIVICMMLAIPHRVAGILTTAVRGSCTGACYPAAGI